jgi:hypothetical protein
LVVVGEDVVDGDIYGDGLQADLVTQRGDDVLLDLAGHLVDGSPVADRHGEVDDRGAAEQADGGVRMTMLEGGAFG